MSTTASEGFALDLAEAGLLMGSSTSDSESTATVDSVRGCEIVVSDGPFAETKESLGDRRPAAPPVTGSD